MDERAVARFARDFRDALERDGASALDRFGWVDGFFGLGFEMDCGKSYEERYGLRLGDCDDVEGSLARVDDLRVLGNAVFSQCRYLTHWSNGYDEDATIWLVAALLRLEELAQPEFGMSMIVSYRFAGSVERAVRDFCARALPGEPLPARIEYSVTDTHALDAYVDEVQCRIPLPGGDVFLAFEVVQTAWLYPGQSAEDLEPVAERIRAERAAEDEEAGDEVQLAWDDGTGAWKPVQE